MYTLTEKRLAIAKPILEMYRAKLTANGSFDSGSLEREVREALGIGYLGFRGIIKDVFKKHPKYKRVAAYYMQHSGATGPTSAFKPLLAKLYGAKSYNDPIREAKQQRYWAGKR